MPDDSRTGHRQRMAVFDATNLDPELGAAYQLKETMAIGKSGDVELFIAALELFDALCVGSRIPAFITLANTLRDWRIEIVNYAVSGGASNAFAEHSAGLRSS